MRKIAFLDVLHLSSFRLIWLAQLFSQIGINLTAFVLALRVYDLTHRNTAVSLLTLSIVVPAAIFGMMAGVLVDRYDKKVVLFLCNFGRALIALGFLFTSESLFMILFLAFLISFVTQFFIPAEGPMIVSLVPKNKLLAANGLSVMTIFLTMLLGGLLAGPSLTVLGLSGTVIFIALMFLAAAFFVSLVPGQTIRSVLARRFHPEALGGALTGAFNHGAGRRFRQEFMEGLDYLKNQPVVFFAVLLLVGSQTVVASSSNLLPGYADRILHISINDASVYLLGPAILGIISGALFASQFGQRLSRRILVNLGIIFVGLAVILLGLSRQAILAQIFLFALGFSNALIDVSANNLLQTKTHDQVRSRVYGVQTALSGATFILPMILAGSFSDLFGVDKVFLVAGGLILLFWLTTIRKYVARFG
ncbi:MFS transporter [Candidatus Microgenomates bacterium]|nr:MFS transporter [Candidatus Microgenomates bacterium]